jgi:hypothetical protein
MAALDDRPHPGKEPTITVEAKTWVVALACRKPKELGYPHEVWTTRLLADHAREHGPRQGHGCLSGLVQGTVCKILAAIAFTVGFAATAMAKFVQPRIPEKPAAAVREPVRMLADQPRVRILGPPFVPNVNPRER